jgi:hypothetical protein
MKVEKKYMIVNQLGDKIVRAPNPDDIDPVTKQPRQVVFYELESDAVSAAKEYVGRTPSARLFVMKIITSVSVPVNVDYVD